MATADTPDAASEGGSAVKTIAIVALLTLIAAGSGALVGLRLVGDVEDVLNQKTEEDAPPPSAPAYSGETSLRRLSPIVSNLAAPPDTWVRLEGSLVIDGEVTPETEVLVAQVGEDVAAYLRTLRLAELQGASGLLHLSEDLNDRVAIRSGEKVRELIIEMLVVQ